MTRSRWLIYAIDRVLGRLTAGKVRIRHYLLVVQPLPARTALSARPWPGLTIRDLVKEDIGRLQFPVPQAVLERRMRSDPVCLVVELHGEFAGYAWFQRGAYEEDEVRCTFVPDAPDCVWDYDVYIAPRHRASRVFGRLWEAAGERLRALGYSRSASRIAAVNEASLRAHAALGAVIGGWAVFVTAGPWQLMLTRGRMALSSRRSRPPVVRVGLI